MGRMVMIKKLVDAGYDLWEAKKAVDVLFPHQEGRPFVVHAIPYEQLGKFFSHEWELQG